MSYFVYILYSKRIDRYYVGETANVAERLKSHLSGISKYTSVSKDWEVVYQQEFSTRLEAIAREKEIKRMKSRKYIVSLVNKE